MSPPVSGATGLLLTSLRYRCVPSVDPVAHRLAEDKRRHEEAERKRLAEEKPAENVAERKNLEQRASTKLAALDTDAPAPEPTKQDPMS